MSERHAGAPGQVKEVTSLANPLVKDIKALALKKFRDQQNAFMAEGLKLVIDALELGWSIKTLVFAKSARANPAVEKAAARTVATGGTVLEVSEKVLGAITRRDNPQMVVGVFRQHFAVLKDIRPRGADVWVALDRVRDPGNLGTILRSADAAGCDAVIVCDAVTDIFNPNVVRASTGVLFSVPIVVAESTAVHAWLKEKGIRTAATTPHTTNIYTQTDLRGPLAIVMGSEQYGLSEFWMKGADVLVRIPMAGQADSLNVAMATIITLFEAVRQRSG